VYFLQAIAIFVTAVFPAVSRKMIKLKPIILDPSVDQSAGSVQSAATAAPCADSTDYAVFSANTSDKTLIPIMYVFRVPPFAITANTFYDLTDRH